MNDWPRLGVEGADAVTTPSGMLSDTGLEDEASCMLAESAPQMALSSASDRGCIVQWGLPYNQTKYQM